MATLPHSAADWLHVSAVTSMTSNAVGVAAPRDINAVGKSRQISLGRSNLSFIARINAAAPWTGRHLWLSSNIRNIITKSSSSTISSKYSTPNGCTYISILPRHLHQPIQRGRPSRQVSLAVTNQISRLAIRSYVDSPQHLAAVRARPARPGWRRMPWPAPNIRLSVIVSQQSLLGRAAPACAIDVWLRQLGSA